jgi:signal transduction histidine kinase
VHAVRSQPGFDAPIGQPAPPGGGPLTASPASQQDPSPESQKTRTSERHNTPRAESHNPPSPPAARPLTAGTVWTGWRTLFRRDAWATVRRPAKQRALAGVAKALADRTGFDPLAVRVAFIALSFVGGAGIALYVGAWLVLPPQSGPSLLAAALEDRRTIGLSAAVASAIGALLIAAAVLGDPAPVGAVSPGVVALAGLVAVARHAGPEDREAASRLASLLTASGPGAVPTRRRVLVAGARALVGVGLVAVCTSSLLAPKHLNGADITAALSALGVVGGFAIVLAPWWLRLGRELLAERRERARAEEKAEMAAHLHDSVLQTLALIQRSANDPQRVQRLARAQERELRSWLFDRPVAGALLDVAPGEGGGRVGTAQAGGRSAASATALTSPAGPVSAPTRRADPGTDSAFPAPRTIAAALRAVQEEVEGVHGLRVEVVTVGDALLDEGLTAAVAAAREAVVNAAKWSEADVVSVYAETEEKAVSLYVRDKGRGFDPALVPDDRKGISESIRNRMRRYGGTAAVRSVPGEGTEVVLLMPRRRVR